MTTTAVFVCAILAVANVCQGYSGEDEKHLYMDLMDKALPRSIRPVQDHNQNITVSLGMSLLHIESLDETTGTLHLNIMPRYSWKDEYVTWDPAQYHGMDHIHIPSDKLWHPDVHLYNKKQESIMDEVTMLVSSDGTIRYIPPIHIESHCELDFTNFPFDTQLCRLIYSSWTYDDKKLDLAFADGFEDVDLADYHPNQEWELVNTSGAIQIRHYDCCPEKYPSFVYFLTLTRRTSYYTYVYLGPAVILSLLAPFIFLLQPSDQQKMTLGIGLLVCFTLFFLEMSVTLPTTHAHTPLIDKYYMAIYVLLCIAMAISTLISNLARRTITFGPPPEFIQKFSMLGVIFIGGRISWKRKWVTTAGMLMKSVMLNGLGRCLCVPVAKDAELPPSGSLGLQVKEWLLIATVVDRLLFLIYIILTVILTIVILASRG